MGEKTAYEISGGIRVHEVEGDIIQVNAVFPGDAEWPAAFALLVKQRVEEQSND